MPVVYSLGHLISDRSVNRKSFDSIAVRVVFHPENSHQKTDVRLIPISADSTAEDSTGRYHPVPAGPEDAQRIYCQIEADTGYRIAEAEAE